MSKNIIYAALDVDDQAFHGCMLNSESGESISFQCHPTIKSLVNQLEKLSKLFPTSIFKVCYKATYIAFTLQRQISALGYHCDVFAPSSIPRVYGNSIKTDRIDAEKLVGFYASGLLSVVTIPNVEDEKDRDPLRSRQYMLQQLAHWRTHIQSLLRRNNLHFKAQTGMLAHWTKPHFHWIERKIEEKMQIQSSLPLRIVA